MIPTKLIALVASALAAQPALAGPAHVLVYFGADCSGKSTELLVNDNSCVNAPFRFLSYKEHGWGSKGQRLRFNSNSCGGNEGLLYDTWAYNGDYFQSGACYNLRQHAPAGKVDAVSIRSQSG
ncbi:hypothetical protein QBC37DRAFT_294022 [Rhypophila decipiens]|uniref:Uncharacterized protein n=1 Tax=Rhypophila decipiens TaxID=261697 RepID=A0AAN7B3N2_9PEZI|nr:hypothetical protein QBC37DRAFT_294022 [Rhypophila decipiens]